MTVESSPEPDCAPGWYRLTGENKVEGPFTPAVLAEHFREGKISGDTLVCRDKTEEWIPYSQAFPTHGAVGTTFFDSKQLLAAKDKMTTRAKKFGAEVQEMAGAAYEKGKIEMKLRSLRMELAKLEKETKPRLLRDFGARAIMEGATLDGSRELFDRAVSLQRDYELANQAGMAGDKGKAKDAKLAATQLQEIQAEIGALLLTEDAGVPCTETFRAKIDELSSVQRKLEEEINFCEDQLRAIPDERRRKARVGLAAAGAIALCAILIGAGIFFSGPSYVDSINDEVGLENSVGFIVVGVRESESSRHSKEHVISTGSGFLVSPKGYLITNQHVIESAQTFKQRPDLKRAISNRIGYDIEEAVWVFIREKKYDADIIHVSSKHDLAILKLRDAPRSMPHVFMLGSKEPPRGSRVHAIGFPAAATVAITEDELMGSIARETSSSGPRNVSEFFRSDELVFTQTGGEVSRTREDSSGIHWLQHTAIITPGNSGGPLIDDDGVVIAINTLTGSRGSGINLSFSPIQCRDEIDSHVKGVKWR